MTHERRLSHSISQSRDYHKFPVRRLTLTAEQERYTHGWGSRFIEKLGAEFPGFVSFLRSCGTLTLWEDCAGLHTPHWVAKELGLSTETLVASDISAGPQKFSHRNVPVRDYQTDILSRRPSPCDRPTMLYVAGFPCTPFSSLHNGSQLLGDMNARQFWAVIETIEIVRPVLCILENVMGIKRCLPDIVAALDSIGDGAYCLLQRAVNPVMLGCPSSRERLYFALVRKDVLPQVNFAILDAKFQRALEVPLCVRATVLALFVRHACVYPHVSRYLAVSLSISYISLSISLSLSHVVFVYVRSRACVL